MKLFICWSGRRGSQAANELAQWLPLVCGDGLKPAVSSGIDKGTLWRTELYELLSESAAGLLCITPEALRSPWVAYEAGILSRAIGPKAYCPTGGPSAGHLYTFLWGVSQAELSGPLAAFQSTDASDERDVRRLVESLAAILPARPDEIASPALDERWPKLWQDLRDRLAFIPKATLPELWPEFEGLFRRKTFEEPTQDCVNQRWLDRHEGARQTLGALRERHRPVAQACRGYVVDLCRDLDSAIDGYAMAISLLLERPHFQLDPDGRLNIDPPGVAAACERRRRRVRELVARLVDPAQAPFFNDAVRFEASEEFAEKENLIHRHMPAVQDLAETVERTRLPPEWPADAFCFTLVRLALRLDRRLSLGGPQVDVEHEWSMSHWEFDRIMYALFLEHRIRSAKDCGLAEGALVLAEAELERVRARNPSRTPSSEPALACTHTPLVALRYALEPILALGAPAAHRTRIHRLCTDVLAFLDSRPIIDDPARTAAKRLVTRSLSAMGRTEPIAEDGDPAGR